MVMPGRFCRGGDDAEMAGHAEMNQDAAGRAMKKKVFAATGTVEDICPREFGG
jgi:hypothetical protein